MPAGWHCTRRAARERWDRRLFQSACSQQSLRTAAAAAGVQRDPGGLLRQPRGSARPPVSGGRRHAAGLAALGESSPQPGSDARPSSHGLVPGATPSCRPRPPQRLAVPGSRLLRPAAPTTRWRRSAGRRPRLPSSQPRAGRGRPPRPVASGRGLRGPRRHPEPARPRRPEGPRSQAALLFLLLRLLLFLRPAAAPGARPRPGAASSAFRVRAGGPDVSAAPPGPASASASQRGGGAGPSPDMALGGGSTWRPRWP